VPILLHTLTSYEEMPVLDWACTFLSKFSSRRQRVQIQDLERLAEGDIKLLKAVLKGVRVTVSVPPGRRLARPIKDLVPNVGNYQFMQGEDETTIKVCHAILLLALLTAYILPGLLRRKIRLQASIPQVVWHLCQCTIENHRSRGNLYNSRWADVQESANARDDVRSPTTSHKTSAREDRCHRTRGEGRRQLSCS